MYDPVRANRWIHAVAAALVFLAPFDGALASRAERGTSPVHVVPAGGPEQPGYVHYYLLRLPDDSLETLVGVEMPGRRIAWSFPEIGVTVVPLVAEGAARIAGKDYEYRHLYGLRPFPDEAGMDRLRRELPERVGRRVAAGTPYCENDGPRSECMSCLGFVLRVLYPGRQGDFPDLPRDFMRAASGGRLSTETLLLYLTGMLDLPDRDARMRRIADLALPEPLREDVRELVAALDTPAPARAAGADSPKKRRTVRASRTGTRPPQRKPL